MSISFDLQFPFVMKNVGFIYMIRLHVVTREVKCVFFCSKEYRYRLICCTFYYVNYSTGGVVSNGKM